MTNKKEQNEINHKIVNKFDNYTITTEMQEQLDKKVEKMHEYFEAKITWMNTENNRKFTKIIKESLTVPGLVEEFNPDVPYQFLGKFLQENTIKVDKNIVNLEEKLATDYDEKISE